MYNKISEPHYYMLVTSLPSFNRSMADHKELPITKIHLEDRLRFLVKKDRQAIESLVDLITRDSFDTDETYLKNYNKVYHQTKNTVLEPILNFFMDWRILTSAIRASIKGNECPKWAYKGNDNLMSTIEANWNKPYFDLHRTYPALPLLTKNMKSENTIAVENMLLELFWEYLSETAFDALFGLDAIATYILRWYILKRWLRRDFDAALTTVNKTIDNILEKTELSL